MVIACICVCNRRHRARSAGRVLNTTHTGGQTNIAMTMTTGLQPYQPGYQPYPTQTYTIQTYPPPMSGQQPTAPPSYSSIQTPQGIVFYISKSKTFTHLHRTILP